MPHFLEIRRVVSEMNHTAWHSVSPYYASILYMLAKRMKIVIRYFNCTFHFRFLMTVESILGSRVQVQFGK